MKVTGASLDAPIGWHSINWKKAYRNVRRLQVRIVKALREGKKRKVRALQQILTRSFAGRALAVRRVTENKGKRTAGIDGEIWRTPRQKTEAIQSLKRKGYRALPLRRVYIPKGQGPKKRPLGIPVMKDRAMQALHKQALDPIAESTADPNSYGFRVGRSTADAIEQSYMCLRHKGSAPYILEADIKGCFDNISHEWILENVPIIHFIRFADDFITTSSYKEVLEEKVKPQIQKHLNVRKLSLSDEKTKITHIKDGFNFLGCNIRKYGRGKLLSKPSKKNFHNFLNKVKQTIKQNKQANVVHLIYLLNPIIRG